MKSYISKRALFPTIISLFPEAYSSSKKCLYYEGIKILFIFAPLHLRIYGAI